MTEIDKATPAKPRRRWFQYPLRSLLILVTVTSVGLAVWVRMVSPYIRQFGARQRLLAIEGQPGETMNAGPFGPEVQSELVLPRWLHWLPWSDRLVKVTGVKLDHCQLTDKKLACLADLRDLERLYMPATEVTDKTLEIVARLPKLKRLSLWRTRISDRGIKLLRQLESLEALDIQETEATEDCLAALEKLPNLKMFRHSIHLSDQGLERLSRFPCQPVGCNDAVYLSGVTDQGIKHLAQFKNASTLYANRCRVGQGWQLLGQLPLLYQVELAETEVNAELTAALAKLPKLKFLKIDHGQVTGSWAEIAESLPKAPAQLELHNTTCTQEGLLALSKMSGSAKIKFVDCPGVSLDAIGQVWGQKVERLQICGRGFDFRPDNGPDIDVEMGISEADLAGLVRFTGLNYLNIQNMPRITRLPALAHLQKLVELTLWFPLCDGVILDASQVTRLWSLSIYDPDTRSDESTNVSAAALRQLGNLRQLEKLEMQGVAASDEHFAFLADLPQLRTLNLLAGNKVTDAGLEHFRTLKNLEELGLCPDDGTDEGIARLQEALPKCNIRR